MGDSSLATQIGHVTRETVILITRAERRRSGHHQAWSTDGITSQARDVHRIYGPCCGAAQRRACGSLVPSPSAAV
jgi:hypothetical protein